MNNHFMKRGRNQRRRQGGGPNPNRALDSNGPDVRIRGTAQQIYDKYLALARDAQSSGDRVYQFTLRERSHVNIQLKQGSFYNTVLSLRSDCSDPTRGEIVCASYYQKVIDRDLDPGTYYLVVDGYGAKAEGAYTIELTTKKA